MRNSDRPGVKWRGDIGAFAGAELKRQAENISKDLRPTVVMAD